MSDKDFDKMWDDCVEMLPQLKGRDDIKSLPEVDLIAVVKILGDVDREEQNGGNKLEKYKDVDTALQVVKEAKFGANAMDKATEDNILTYFETPGYYPSNILINNDNLVASPDLVTIAKNQSGINQIHEIREDLIKNVQMNVYEHLNFGEKKSIDLNEVNKIIDSQPLAVSALMAISQKSEESGWPKIKIADEGELARKIADPRVQDLANNIPLSSYEHTFTQAIEKAPVVPELVPSRRITASKMPKVEKEHRSVS